MFVGAENHSTVIIRVNGGEFMRTPKGPEPNPPTSLRKKKTNIYTDVPFQSLQSDVRAHTGG